MFWLPLPAPASWPWLGASALVQSLYYLLLGLAYQRTDLSLVYPLMRGTAPMLTTLVSVLLLGQALPATGWVAITLLCAGVAWMGGRQRLCDIGLPMLLAAVIAGYTLLDARGVRLSGQVASYAMWLFFLSALPLPLWMSLLRTRGLGAHLRGYWRTAVVGGACTLGAYAIVLWAMTRSPVAQVAALREVSILFALLLSALLTREHPGARRWWAAGLIVAGAGLLHLA